MGISSTVFGPLTFSEAAGLADALGLATIEGDSRQKVSAQIDKNLDFQLQPDGIAAVKARLEELRLKMVAYRVESIPFGREFRREALRLRQRTGREDDHYQRHAGLAFHG